MENKEDDNEHDGNKNNVHISNVEDSAPYYCMDCDVTAKNGLESINHIGRMHPSWIKLKKDDAVRYWCLECDVSCKYEDEFSKHYNQKHRFECNLCKNKFTQNIKLENHIKDHIRTGYFIPGARYCMDCDTTIMNESEFVFHINQTHPDSWIRYKKEGNIIICLCIECEVT